MLPRRPPPDEHDAEGFIEAMAPLLLVLVALAVASMVLR